MRRMYRKVRGHPFTVKGFEVKRLRVLGLRIVGLGEFGSRGVPKPSTLNPKLQTLTPPQPKPKP